MTKEEIGKQFDLLIETYQIKIGKLSVDKKAGLEKIRSAIESGKLKVTYDSSKLNIEQKLSKPTQGISTVNYKEMDGEAFLAFESTPANSGNFLKVYSLLAYLSGHDVELFKRMFGHDVKVALALGFFFLEIS